MQPPSLRHSSTCPATAATASAPLRYALLKRHPNAFVPMHFRASTQSSFSGCEVSHLRLCNPSFSHIHQEGGPLKEVQPITPLKEGLAVLYHIIMAPKGRGGRIVRNTRLDQSQLSSRRSGEQTVDIDSSQPPIHVLGQQNSNNDEPHLTHLNVGSASNQSPQVLSQSSPQLDGVNSSDASALDAEDNELPNVGQSSVHAETRSNGKLRFTYHTVTRDITKDLLSRMPSPAPRWQDYCPNMKDELFKGFLEKHEFASNYDKAMARTVWNKTMHDRYPDILKRARDRAFKEANSTSIADIKGHGPKAMKVDVWNGLVDHWLDSKWQNKSVAGQKNRAAMPTHKLHTAGSISFGEHKRRKEVKLKRRVSFLEVYDDVHKKKSGEYVSESVSQTDITEAIKEALPSAINAVLPSVVNEAIQNNLLSLLSKIPGFPQEKNH
ncbi:hypothetical protein Ahy_B03g065973 [Arachis hypogaea]|uniref:Uncharacterized protein n=1 Tax=Arachis hypogaea TaxID=3818 RepID=A0A445A2U6_ARAHY|nr:hypothetical protein Ahy_B03g065973 [Arachis hypogaea]